MSRLLYHRPSAPRVGPGSNGPGPSRSANLLAGRAGLLALRSRSHAELCHELHLVEHQVIPLDQPTIDLEDLDEIAFHLSAGGGHVTHRGLERSIVRPRENALHDHIVALAEDLLRLDTRVGERPDPILVVLLGRLRALDLDVSWARQLDIRSRVASDRLHVMGDECLEAALDHRLRL